MYLQWINLTYKYACVCIYMYILKCLSICTYTYECAERDFRHTFTAIKIMVIEKLKRICKTQAVILLSYFSSVTMHFVYVVSKWLHQARLKMSPDLSSTPFLKAATFFRPAGGKNSCAEV